VPPEGGVDVDQAGAGADDRRLPRGVDPDPAHSAEVDDDAARRRVAAVAVAARARDDVDPVLARPADGPLDVRDRLAEDDRVRVHAVEASVDEEPRLRVGGAPGRDDGTIELARELAQASGAVAGRRAARAGTAARVPAASVSLPARSRNSRLSKPSTSRG
jgi:hypothetical protein